MTNAVNNTVGFNHTATITRPARNMQLDQTADNAASLATQAQELLRNAEALARNERRPRTETYPAETSTLPPSQSIPNITFALPFSESIPNVGDDTQSDASSREESSDLPHNGSSQSLTCWQRVCNYVSNLWDRLVNFCCGCFSSRSESHNASALRGHPDDHTDI